MARKVAQSATSALPEIVVVGSDNFLWTPPYRSYPAPPSELEQLAARLGIDDEELRALLREEVGRRLRTRGEASPQPRGDAR